MNLETQRRYIRNNKEAVKKRSREYYQRTKERQKKIFQTRYIQTRDGAYRWFNKIVTGYLPYEQGDKKEVFAKDKLLLDYVEE